MFIVLPKVTDKVNSQLQLVLTLVSSVISDLATA
jgi:hypothetical protein